MARVAFTLRIDAEERAALENLSKVERRPANQLLNEAVRNFLLRRRPLRFDGSAREPIYRKWRSTMRLQVVAD